jgi:hypothetical protein
MIMQDMRIGWSIASYLDNLKEDLSIASLQGASGNSLTSEERRNE